MELFDRNAAVRVYVYWAVCTFARGIFYFSSPVRRYSAQGCSAARMAPAGRIGTWGQPAAVQDLSYSRWTYWESSGKRIFLLYAKAYPSLILSKKCIYKYINTYIPIHKNNSILFRIDSQFFPIFLPHWSLGFINTIKIEYFFRNFFVCF